MSDLPHNEGIDRPAGDRQAQVLAVAWVRRWVAEQNERIGEHIDEMRVEMDVDPRAITIHECRPPWREDLGRAGDRRHPPALQ